MMQEEARGQVLLYQRDDGSAGVEVKLEDQTVWLTQKQIAELFQTTRENVTMHARNIFDERELDPTATSKEFLQVRQEGGRQVKRQVLHYNLDFIISVGYRVKSKVATQFRIWATQCLKEYLVQGYSLNEQRLISD
ncbi:virulence RhuM family protein [Kocuria sp.]|uniref:virulence RhuM family protein n=1 Tax=Kocuria sp. TaxID=1871328 RepID=UPI0026E06AD7|nr:RhuM family protein [Kocuria sp.]MDO5617194.1 RhuM family protein [Kocuria sp.]